jgi:hypothetical protein
MHGRTSHTNGIGPALLLGSGVIDFQWWVLGTAITGQLYVFLGSSFCFFSEALYSEIVKSLMTLLLHANISSL